MMRFQTSGTQVLPLFMALLHDESSGISTHTWTYCTLATSVLIRASSHFSPLHLVWF